MNRVILILSIIFITSTAYAENFICYDLGTTYINRTVNGDGVGLGITGVNNSNIIAGCIYAQGNEWSLARQGNHKIDIIQSEGNRVIPLTQSELDAIAQAEADAQESNQCVSVNDLGISIKDAFIAWLTVYNSKVPAQYRVTGAELKTQLRSDLGISCQ